MPSNDLVILFQCKHGLYGQYAINIDLVHAVVKPIAKFTGIAKFRLTWRRLWSQKSHRLECMMMTGTVECYFNQISASESKRCCAIAKIAIYAALQSHLH